MLQFKQSDTEAVLILTLSEKVTINDPYYLFVFTHVLTKEKVKFIKYTEADESNFAVRYNQFTINPLAVFADRPIGEWHYKIYEQESETNTDEELAGGILEYGKLKLDRAIAFEFIKYNQSQTFTTYNG